jgi:hypothetical protein
VSLLANWGKSLSTTNYVASLRLGTPATELVVELDTGSDQSWVQCKPCADCYEQRDPVFDPTASSTYSAVPCGARECQELASSSSSRNCSSDNNKTCPYEVSYDDDSHTVGDLARDTLTLSPSPSPSPADTVPGFVFGCGHSNAGTFGEVDGLLGLGLGKASLPSQVAARYGAAFSYCLPSSPSAAGYLSFGGAAAPANAQFTEMVRPDVLLPQPHRHNGRRAGDQGARVRVRDGGRDHHRLEHHVQPPATERLRGAAVVVPKRHGQVQVQEGTQLAHLRHVLRLHRPRDRADTGGGAGARRRWKQGRSQRAAAARGPDGMWSSRHKRRGLTA